MNITTLLSGVVALFWLLFIASIVIIVVRASRNQPVRNAALFPNRDLSQDYMFPGDSVTTKPIQAVAEINSTLPGYGSFPNRQWELLRAGQQMAQQANTPLLIVNEPIYVGSGENSDVNYNSFYERDLYDLNLDGTFETVFVTPPTTGTIVNRTIDPDPRFRSLQFRI